MNLSFHLYLILDFHPDKGMIQLLKFFFNFLFFFLFFCFTIENQEFYHLSYIWVHSERNFLQFGINLACFFLGLKKNSRHSTWFKKKKKSHIPSVSKEKETPFKEQGIIVGRIQACAGNPQWISSDHKTILYLALLLFTPSLCLIFALLFLEILLPSPPLFSSLLSSTPSLHPKGGVHYIYKSRCFEK